MLSFSCSGTWFLSPSLLGSGRERGVEGRLISGKPTALRAFTAPEVVYMPPNESRSEPQWNPKDQLSGPKSILRHPAGLNSRTINRSLIRSTSSLAPVMVLTAVLNGLIAIVTARSLGVEGRGQLVLLIAIVSATTLIVSAGVNVSGRYHLVSQSQRIALSEYLGLTFLLALAVAAICPVVVVVSFRVSDTVASTTLIFVSVVYGAFFIAALHCRDAINAFGHTTAASALSGLGSGVTIATALILGWRGSESVPLYAGAFALGSMIETAAHLALLRRLGHHVALRLDRGSAFMLLRRGAPALGLTAGQSLTFRLDRFVIAFLIGPAAVGIYSVAAAVSEILRLIPAGFGQIAMFRTASRSIGQEELDRARRFILLAMIPCLATLAWFAPLVLERAFGSEFGNAATPLRILLVGEIAIMSFQIDSRILAGRGLTKASGVSGLIGLVSVLILDLALVPHFDIAGAAWASVFSYSAMGVSAYIFARRSRRRPENPDSSILK